MVRIVRTLRHPFYAQVFIRRPTPVSLERIKADKRLAGMALVRISGLSVQPVSDAEWRIIRQMGGLVR